MAERKKRTKKAKASKTKGRPVAKKPSLPKKKSAPKKKGPAKKPASVAAPPKQAIPVKLTPKPVGPPAPPAPAPAGGVIADEVVLGHVMALRPRIHVGFKPSAFSDAKRALADARYATIEEAARAVAEKAIEISNDSSRQNPFSRR